MEMPHEPPLVLESKPLEISEEFKSTEETIVAALMDDFTSKIGIFGAGGVGKTKMASRIGERVKREKLIKIVMMVRVGPNSDHAEDRIAYEIYHYLGVGLNGGDVVAQASELLSKMVRQGIRVLIILDDVWRDVDLERAGIPKDSCNLMIVSRFEKVCSGMGCDVIFELQKLIKEDDVLMEKSGSSHESLAWMQMKRFMLHDSILSILEQLFGGTRSLYERKAMDVSSSMVAVASLPKLQVLVALTSLPELQVLDVTSRPILRNLITLLNLDIRDCDIFRFPVELRNFTNLRLLNLTNCVYCQTIESGIISSLVLLEELYMLGSFSDWELVKEGEIGVNASINELESLGNLIALQIQIRGVTWDSSVLTSRLLRLNSYVISMPEQLICRYEDSPSVSFPAVEFPGKFGETILLLILPNVTSLKDWMPAMLRWAECLNLSGDGSKSAMDELTPDGLKFLKRLHIFRCSTIEYLVDGIIPIDDLFQSLESLWLYELPLLKELSNSQFILDLLWEMEDLAQFAYSTLLDLYRRQTQGFCFSRLRYIYIYRCPKMRCLFSSSMAWNFSRFELIAVDSCEMMEEIFSDDVGGKTSDSIEFSRLTYLKLHNLPNLTHFCKNMRVDFPQLKDISFMSLQNLRIFCPAGSNDLQSLFSEKVEFDNLNKLEIRMLESVTSIWCHLTSPSLFITLEQLVVASCNILTHLMSHSIAKLLVKLDRLTIEDCFTMERVIVDDGEEGTPENHESLFPQLRILALKGLPSLKSFYHGMVDLKLPSLEVVTVVDCRGMTEFYGGKINMPVLSWVKTDSWAYKIVDVDSVQHLFNDKHLFVHNLPIHSPNQEVEDIMEDEDCTREPVLSHPQRISKASGGNIGENLLYDIEAKSLSSISNQNTMIEENAADSHEAYFEVLFGDGDASISSYETSNGEKIEETNIEAKPEVSMNEVLDIKRYLDDFILFCFVLPRYYEFTKDILVSQWMIGGLIELGEDKMTEEVCTKCFDTLVERNYFVPSEYDYVFNQMKYKIGDGKEIDCKVSYTSEVKHVSLAFKELGVLNKYSCLRTLVIYDSYGIDHLPSDIFLELKALMILNLSGTNVAVLPGSIENLKELRFFDMSKTPIRWLPETISYFSHLHTLNLGGCSKLECLPKCTNKLINLQHLVVDVSRLSSMPIGMGNLSNLQTLNMFSVGVGDGRRVTELKDLNKLRGSFSLLNLENVGSKEEALEACLYKKVRLRKIELHWSDIQDEKCIYEEEILESLQPPLGTQELKILFYSGGVLPSWIDNPSFSELASIALDECKYCSSLPTLGELPSLKSLSIIENNVMTEIGSSFFSKRADRNRVAFPKLEKLSFDSMSKLEKWSGFEDGDFPSLRLLIIEYCPELVGFSFLSCLSSLSGLEIRYCPEFSCLLEDGIPPSLESLMIKQSPKLKAQCCDGQWSKVASVPSIYIDDQEVFPKNSE